MLVRLADLPTGKSRDFLDSSFFTARAGASLPSPGEVRKRGLEIEGGSIKGARPVPAVFEDQELLVKYGYEITIAEAQCLWFFNRYMKDKVPTPELYGWRQDGEDTFIYMQLVQGDTLESRWPSLNESDKKSICKQLKACVDTWRELQQENEPYFIGHIGGQGVGDIIFRDANAAHAGPFPNLGAFHDFFARLPFRHIPEMDPRRDCPELKGLVDDRPVVFTHADLDKSNILISRPSEESSPPRLVAIIDWHQSGWYPVDWEWLKAQWLCEPLGSGRRDTAWLDDVMAQADDDYFYGWEYVNWCM